MGQGGGGYPGYEWEGAPTGYVTKMFLLRGVFTCVFLVLSGAAILFLGWEFFLFIGGNRYSGYTTTSRRGYSPRRRVTIVSNYEEVYLYISVRDAVDTAIDVSRNGNIFAGYRDVRVKYLRHSSHTTNLSLMINLIGVLAVGLSAGRLTRRTIGGRNSIVITILHPKTTITLCSIMDRGDYR